MEVNTVVISLDRLKELEKAENKLNEPRSKTIVIQKNMYYSYIIETDEECAEKLAKDLKDAKEEIDELKDELQKITEDYVSKIIEKIHNVIRAVF